MRKPFYLSARKAWYLKINQPDGSVKTKKLARDKDEAFRIWNAMRERADRIEEPDEITLFDVIQLYVSQMKRLVEKKQLANSTLRKRMYDLAKFLKHGNFARMAFKDLKPYHVTDWLDSTKWNATTQHHALENVKRAIRWSVDQQRIPSSPIDKMRVEKGPGRTFTISPELHRKLFDGFDDGKSGRRRVRSMRQILIALRLTGCRPSEIIKLTIEQLGQEVWRIDEHKTRRHGKTRTIYPCPCLETLARIASHGRTTGPVFLSDYKTPWKYSMLRQRMERAKKRLNVDPDCVLYSYRHASITEALLAGVDTATVAEMHGTSIRVIESTYAHVMQHASHVKRAAFDVVKKRRMRGD